MISGSRREKIKGIVIKIIIVILSLFIMAVAAFFLNDTPFISKYMLGIRRAYYETVIRLFDKPVDNTKTYTKLSIQQMQEIVPFQVPTPMWLPEGYKFDDASVSDFGRNYYSISYEYIDNNDNTISFDICSRDMGKHNILVDVDEVDINGIKVLILELQTDEGYISYSSIYKNNKGLFFWIGNLDDKETLIKIVENMS